MQTIYINRTKCHVPTEWNELSPRQILQITRVLNQERDPVEKILLILKIVCGMSWWAWIHQKPDVLHDHLHLVDFVLDGKNTLTKQLFPVIYPGFMKRGFFGPEQNFDNLVMEEFAFTEQYFLDFMEGEKQCDLDNLVAVLYRPGKHMVQDPVTKQIVPYNHQINPDGDHRIPFNQNVCAFHAAHTIKGWSHALKLAIVQWYGACRLQLVDDFGDTVFKDGEGDPARWGLWSMMRSVATSGTHGNFPMVEKMYVKTAMMELDEMVLEADKLKQPPQAAN